MPRVLALVSCLAFGLAEPAAPSPSPGAPGAGSFAEADAFAEVEAAAAAGDPERARACAARLLALYAEYGDRHPRAPDALAYAARCHDVAGDFGAAARTRELLVERFPQAPVARLALLALAHQYQAIARYDRAAAVMETYAKRHPDDKQTPELAVEAALLRAGLGQEAEALALLARAEEQHRLRDPARAAALFWARAQLLPGTYPNDQARREHAEQYLKRHGARGGLARLILAEVAIADVDWRRSCKQKGTPLDLCVTFQPAAPVAAKGKRPAPNCAGPAARAVSVHARDRKLAEAAQRRFQEALRIGSAWRREGDDEALRAKVAEALDLAAIAVADADLAAYLQLRVPTGLAFTVEAWRRELGTPGQQAIYAEQVRTSETSKKRLLEFLTAKTAQGQALARRYEHVAAGKQSPRGMFAAAARVAVVQATYADELLTAEVPGGLGNEAAVKAYCGAMRDQAAAIEQSAKEALTYCLGRAEAFQYTDAAVAFCEGELERRWPREFPALRELFARGQSLPAEPESVPVQLAPPEEAALKDMD